MQEQESDLTMLPHEELLSRLPDDAPQEMVEEIGRRLRQAPEPRAARGVPWDASNGGS